MFESRCASQVTLSASNGVGASATMNLTVNLKNLRCAVTASTILDLIKAGPNIIKGGKVVGQWVIQQGQKVGQIVTRNGQPIAAETEQEAEQAGEDAGAVVADGSD